MSKIATLVGATGLIGNYLLRELLNDPFYETVRILVRRPVDITGEKLEKKLVDFEDADSILVALTGSDVVFCCVGTTQKKVRGDKSAYRKVDVDIPVMAAKCSKTVGCEKFLFVSSVGANKNSRNFYLSLKGEVEESVKSVGLESLHIMQPSMLVGDRQEFRLGEKIGAPLMQALSVIIPPKYRAIHARTVAVAMLAASLQDDRGNFVHTNEEIRRLARKQHS